MIYSLENPIILPFRLTSSIQKSEMNRYIIDIFHLHEIKKLFKNLFNDYF